MNTPLIITLKALLRRIITMTTAGVVGYLVDAFPQILVDAVKADPKTAIALPILMLVVEFIQKYIRERKKAQNEHS